MTSAQNLLEPGSTCWQTARAHQVAVLIDASAYVPAMQVAIENAKQSIMLLGWDFDPQVPLGPSNATGKQGIRFCDLVRQLLTHRPDVEVKILIWDMTLVFSIQRRNSPRRAARRLPDGVEYRLDARHPKGACHHQKVLVVDDAIAFCGSADFTRNRWDTPAHAPDDRRRGLPNGKIYAPRHEVVIAVDGPAARALGDLVRDRWKRAGGTASRPTSQTSNPWPNSLKPDFTSVAVGISRTEPAHETSSEIREIQQLHLRSIARAQHRIYIENQYVTSALIRDALVRRLIEPRGPEVVLVGSLRSGARADRLSMDRARNVLLHRLRTADRFGRFRAFAPLDAGGEPITIHSKVMIADDRLLHVGSANLNNRSLGLDTECDVSVESTGGADAPSGSIDAVLARLLAEHIGCTAAAFAAALPQRGLIGSIDALSNEAGRRLQPLHPGVPGSLDQWIARARLFDPFGASDNWRPWRRPDRAFSRPDCP